MDKPLSVSDPSQKFKFIVAAVFAGLLVLILLAVKDLKPEDNKDNLGFSTIISQSSTSTVRVVGSSSTLIAATSTGPHFICNEGSNDAFVAFAASVSTSSDSESRGMLISATDPQCEGPFDYIGVHAAHTKSGTTSIQITVFP